MKLDGGYVTLLMGSTVPVPAKPEVLRALHQVQVSESQDQPSGFQLQFRAARDGPGAVVDYPLLRASQLATFSRVIVVVTLRSRPHVLIDGIIADVQHQPDHAAGGGLITVTGEDLTLLMDLEEKQREHPGLNAPAAVAKVLAGYTRYGIVPKIIPTRASSPPSPLARIPVQCETDLEFLRWHARREGGVFYLDPGPLPGSSTAYWGPPPRLGVPQKALTVGMGTASNVDSLDFRHQALAPRPMAGYVQDPASGKRQLVESAGGGQVPLAKNSAMKTARRHGRRVAFRGSGASVADARARIQAAANESAARAVVGEGQLNALAYGGVLKARKLVGVRGVGSSHDGLYLVTEVTHTLRPGSYTQSFTISREGTGSTVPVVRV